MTRWLEGYTYKYHLHPEMTPGYVCCYILENDRDVHSSCCIQLSVDHRPVRPVANPVLLALKTSQG